MSIATLKRIKLDSAQAVTTWCTAHADLSEDFMIVTNAKPSSRNHVSSAQVREAVHAARLLAGPSYTLNGGLLGHVVRSA